MNIRFLLIGVLSFVMVTGPSELYAKTPSTTTDPIHTAWIWLKNLKAVNGQVRNPYRTITFDAFKKLETVTVGGHVGKGHFHLEDKDFTHFKHFPSLKNLHLKEVDGITNGALAEIGKIHQLEEIIAWDGFYNDQGLAHLINLKNLRYLSMAASRKVTNGAMKTLRELPKLETLIASGTSIDYNGFLELKKHNAIREIIQLRLLPHAQGLTMLNQIKSLEKLVISVNTSSGQSEEEMQVHGVRPSPHGELIKKVITAGLTYDLYGSRTSPQPVVAGFKRSKEKMEGNETQRAALKWLKSLQGTGNLHINLYTNLTVEGMLNLKTLNLGGHVAGGAHLHVKPENLKHLKAMPSLRRLNFAELSGLNGRAMAVLGSLKHIEEMNLADASCEGKDLVHLKNMTNLKTLNLSFARKVDDEGMKALARLPLLENLNIVATAVGDAGMKALSQSPSLEVLTMNNVKRVGPAGYLHLNKAPKLKCVFSDATVSYMAVDLMKNGLNYDLLIKKGQTLLIAANLNRTSSSNYQGTLSPLATKNELNGHALAVLAVIQGGQAKAAGIIPGDIILSYNGKDVEDLRSLNKVKGEVTTRGFVDVTLFRPFTGEDESEGRLITLKMRPGQIGIRVPSPPAEYIEEPFEFGN